MASDYEVQLRVVHGKSETVVAWHPRKPETHGPIIDELCRRLEAKGIGVARTSDHVLTDLRAAWQEMLRELKQQV